jgi:ferric-dicitrate binding protein FerR (iron transport regulator)
LTGEVAVSKVSVNGNELLCRLQADMKLTYNASSDSNLVLTSKTNEDIKWQKQQLLFRNSSLKDIANTIENWYQVKVKITNNEAAACTFTANFDATTALVDLLDMLQMASGLTYKIR